MKFLNLIVICLALCPLMALSDGYTFYKNNKPIAYLSTDGIDSNAEYAFETLKEILSFNHMKKEVISDKDSIRKYYFFGKKGRPQLKIFLYPAVENPSNAIEKIRVKMNPDFIYYSQNMITYWHHSLGIERFISGGNKLYFFNKDSNLFINGLKSDKTRKELITMQNIDGYIWGDPGEVIYTETKSKNILNTITPKEGTVLVKDVTQFVIPNTKIAGNKVLEILKLSDASCAYKGKLRSLFFCQRNKRIDQTDLKELSGSYRLVYSDSSKVIFNIKVAENRSVITKKLIQDTNPAIAYSFEFGFTSVFLNNDDLFQTQSPRKNKAEHFSFQKSRRELAMVTFVDTRENKREKFINTIASVVPYDILGIYKTKKPIVKNDPFYKGSDNLVGFYKKDYLSPQKEIPQSMPEEIKPINRPIMTEKDEPLPENKYLLSLGMLFSTLESIDEVSANSIERARANAHSFTALHFSWSLNHYWDILLDISQSTYEYDITSGASILEIEGDERIISSDIIYNIPFGNHALFLGAEGMHQDFSVDSNSSMSNFDIESLSAIVGYQYRTKRLGARFLVLSPFYSNVNTDDTTLSDFSYTGLGAKLNLNYNFTKHFALVFNIKFLDFTLEPTSSTEADLKHSSLYIGPAFTF